MKRFTWSRLSIAIALVGAALLGVKQYANAAFQSGTNNGYYWQRWTSDGLTGSVNYTNGSGGNYNVTWNCNGNFTCGKGWSTGSNTRNIGYNCGVHTHNGGGGVFAVYGWTRNPLREYYVNERWGGSRPTGTSMGSLNSDGGSYGLYRSQRVNAPSIDGTQTFWQVFSTRTSQAPTGQNRVVTFNNHRNAWANAGWGLGSSHSYQILLTEAYGQSNGRCNATVWQQ
jgi:endo-1,4-beta-xylanase